MMADDCIPAASRAKIDDLVARDQSARAVELLEIWVRQHSLTPWALRRLGELHLAAGDRRAAGRAFFWSGERDDAAHQQCIDEFLRGLRRKPRRIVRSLPSRARASIERMPGRLPAELAALGVTDTVVERSNRTRPQFVVWLELWTAIAIFVVGLVTVARWLIGIVRDWF